MRKLPVILLLIALLFSGCGKTNGLLGTEDQQTTVPRIESGLTAADVIKLYLSLNGYGNYVLAYELLTNERKRETTINDIKSYAEMGKTELEKVLSIQEKGDLSLVSAVVKFTDDKTQEGQYKIQDFVLEKQAGEWRITQENLLSEAQLGTLTTLIQEKAIELKNNKDVQKFLVQMKEQNLELADKAKEEVKEQVVNVKEELSDVVKDHGDDVKQGISETLNGLKSGFNLK